MRNVTVVAAIIAISVLLLHFVVVPNAMAQQGHANGCILPSNHDKACLVDKDGAFEITARPMKKHLPTLFWKLLKNHEDGANYKGPGDLIPPPNHGAPPPIFPGPSGPGAMPPSGGPTP